MATGPRYTVNFRRKREGKTNYHTRLAILKSQKHRLVIRKSNKFILCQIIDYTTTGDKILLSATSKQIVKMGWKHSCSNIPAAYLTGLIIGEAAKKAKIAEVILDKGLYSSTKGSVIYAALKGVVDSGLIIPHDPKIFPTEDRLIGKHTKSKDLLKDIEAVKKKIGANNEKKR
jgi:large subunit ribosomal protein L18